LNEAVQHFATTQRLLRQGDLAGYQREIEQAQSLVEQAQRLLRQGGGSGSGSPTPSPTPTGTPSG
jgi:hypothetical protein